MTTPADDLALETAFEAYLAGRPVPDEAADTFDGVAAFAGAVRSTATQPGRPNAALAELLATGLLTDQSSPSARTAGAAGTSPSRKAPVRRRRFAMIAPAMLAKLLTAGTLAKAATSAGVVLVVAAGAGATGLLGDEVKDTLSTVVGAADESTEEGTTDQENTDEETLEAGDVEAPAVAAEVPVAPVEEFDPEKWAAGPGTMKFSDWVLLAAREGQVDGQTVAKYARMKHVPAEELEELEGIEGLEDLQDVADVDDTDTVTTDDEVETAESEDSGATAHGNGGGNGGGNSGRGNGNN